MTKTRLFIEDVEVELNSQVQFLLNQQFTDISNPATIFNDWSKTIDIPFTSHNNELFGHLYNEDRLIAFSNNPDESLIGIYFNPNKKLNFRLEWNGILLMSGYVKTNSVKKTLTGGSYNITLNGELGRVFQELDKITMDLTKLDTVDYKYVLDTRQYANFPLNKDVIYQSWNSVGQKHVSIDDTEIEWTDIVGFAPSNAFVSDFDYKSFVQINELPPVGDREPNTNYSKYTIKSIESLYPEMIEGINFSSAILGDGLSPMTITALRSYLQLPFVYINKLFGIFLKKCQTLTGYNFVLNQTWFNSNNPYWYNTVMMLNTNHTSEDVGECGNVEFYLENQTDTGHNNIVLRPTGGANNYYKEPYLEEKYGVLWLNFDDVADSRPKNVNFNVYLVAAKEDMPTGTGIHEEQIFKIVVTLTDVNAERYNAFSIAVFDKEATVHEIDLIGYDYWVAVDKSVMFNITENAILIPIELNVALSNVPAGLYRMGLTCEWVNSEAPKLDNDESPTMYVRGGYTSQTIHNSNMLFTGYSMYHKSNSIFNINNYWNNEVSVWKTILNYCKMFHILILCDDVNKTIRFEPYYYFFTENSNIENYTNKLDASKDIIIAPNRPDEKYLLFDYDESEVGLLKEYSEKYGMSYGGLRVSTYNRFNENSKRFLEGIKQSSIYSPVSYSIDDFANNKVLSGTRKNYLVNNLDADNNEVNIFGSIFFCEGRALWDNWNPNRRMAITDDLSIELKNADSVCYQFQNAIQTSVYTKLSTEYKGEEEYFSILWNIPKEIYYIPYEENENPKTLYQTFWGNYISELYNEQNKKITAYLRLTPQDYMNLKTNKFISIKNQLYFVNKICDYDINNTESTKCELITVQNFDNYRGTDFGFWGVSPYLRELRTNQWNGSIFNDYLITGWNHENQQFTLVDVQLDGQSVGNNWTKTITVTNTTTPSLYDLTFDVTPPVPLIIQPSEQRVLTFTIEDSNGEQRTASIILRNPNIASESSEMVDD